jgi:thymidylate synthase (FAD)
LEDKLEKEIKVLDKGYVKLIGHFVDDNTPLLAARMSTGNPTGIDEKKDDKLREYLWKNNHVSPFEMANMTFEINVPLFVLNQLIRHKMNKNIFSQRYAEVMPEYYVPEENRIKGQSKTNKQASEGELSEEIKNNFLNTIKSTQETIHNEYDKYIKDGISRELARINQPQSTYTKAMISMNLRDILFMLKQRLDSHAQYETRTVAEAIAEFVKQYYPKTYKVAEEYTFNSVQLSNKEKQTLIDFLEDCNCTDGTEIYNVLIKLKG